jgi:hypothetical protein
MEHSLNFIHSASVCFFSNLTLCRKHRWRTTQAAYRFDTPVIAFYLPIGGVFCTEKVFRPLMLHSILNFMLIRLVAGHRLNRRFNEAVRKVKRLCLLIQRSAWTSRAAAMPALINRQTAQSSHRHGFKHLAGLRLELYPLLKKGSHCIICSRFEKTPDRLKFQRSEQRQYGSIFRDEN